MWYTHDPGVYIVYLTILFLGGHGMLKKLKKDVYLDEAVNVIKDMKS